MSDTHTVPDGCLEDSQGRYVPLRLIRPERVVEDQTVRDLVARAEAASAALADVKHGLLADTDAYVALVGERYGVDVPAAANLTMESYDGRLRVERVRADRVTIGPEIQAAEILIRQILDEINDPTARAIVDRTFRRNPRTRELSAARLVDLVRVEIDDDRWRTAVQAIRDAMRASGSVTYFRAYRRAEPDQPWVQVPLDFSAIVPRPMPVAARPGRAPADPDEGTEETLP